MSSKPAADASVAERPDVAALYARHRVAMLRTAGAVLSGTGVEPGEAVAQVVANLHDMHVRGTLRDVDSWEAYLVSSVRNAAARLAGRTAREQPVEDVDLVVVLPGAPAPTEETVVMRDEARRRLARLDPRKRAIIAGLYVTELTLAELGEQFGITPQRVGQLRDEALNKMREE